MRHQKVEAIAVNQTKDPKTGQLRVVVSHANGSVTSTECKDVLDQQNVAAAMWKAGRK